MKLGAIFSFGIIWKVIPWAIIISFSKKTMAFWNNGEKRFLKTKVVHKLITCLDRQVLELCELFPQLGGGSSLSEQNLAAYCIRYFGFINVKLRLSRKICFLAKCKHPETRPFSPLPVLRTLFWQGQKISPCSANCVEKREITGKKGFLI